jgi:hypothetical protein
MKKNIFLILAIIFLYSFTFVNAKVDCSYTELDKTYTYYYISYIDEEFEAPDDQLAKVTLYRGTTCYTNSNPSQSQCKSESYSKYKSVTLQPSQSTRFDYEYSCYGGCYKVVYEKYDCFECEDGDEDCDDEEYLKCVNGEWDNKGIKKGECGVDCLDGETKCSSYNFYECDDYGWDNQGKVVGECGINCISDNDCSSGKICESNQCYDGCRENSDCSSDEICSNKKCINNPCNDVKCDEYCSGGVNFFWNLFISNSKL